MLKHTQEIKTEEKNNALTYLYVRYGHISLNQYT